MLNFLFSAKSVLGVHLNLKIPCFFQQSLLSQFMPVPPCPLPHLRLEDWDLSDIWDPGNLCSVPLTKQKLMAQHVPVESAAATELCEDTEWTQTAQNRAWPREKKEKKRVEERKEQSRVFLSLFSQVLHEKLPHPCEKSLLFRVEQR